MSEATQASGGGVGVAGLLGVLFVGLKLTGVISWSWWWVLSPFWIPFALIIGLGILFGGAYMLYKIFQ